MLEPIPCPGRASSRRRSCVVGHAAVGVSDRSGIQIALRCDFTSRSYGRVEIPISGTNGGSPSSLQTHCCLLTGESEGKSELVVLAFVTAKTRPSHFPSQHDTFTCQLTRQAHTIHIDGSRSIVTKLDSLLTPPSFCFDSKTRCLPNPPSEQRTPHPPKNKTPSSKRHNKNSPKPSPGPKSNPGNKITTT